jgi:hypothetical protein
MESRTSGMKNKAQQTFVHSKIEAIQNSQDIAVLEDNAEHIHQIAA